MRKTILGATVAVALTATAGHDIEATHSSAAVVLSGTGFFRARCLSQAIP